MDYHVEITADYERSVFGVALEELVYLIGPVSATPLPAANPEYYLSAEDSGKERTKLSIPKELWRLVDALYTGNALREKDLFNCSADPGE